MSQKKIKIAVVTGTRAEYGLLKMTLKKILLSKKLELSLIVTGTHLSPSFGSTYKEIEKDGFFIDYKVEMLVSSDTNSSIAKSMGLAIISFAQIFEKDRPDVLLFLGDRFEILAASIAAMSFNICLAHIAGGEITEGAIDEQIRHSLTKLSHIHFPCSDIYENNIRKLNEESWRIYNVGHPCLELIKSIKLTNKKTLCKKYNIDLTKKIFLITLHPTTLNSIEIEKKQAFSFFSTIDKIEDVNLIVTYPNSDTNGQIIIDEIKKIKNKNIRIVPNLGSHDYLSMMKISDLVIGNSSSGLVEGPYFKIPIINYGNRQDGRIKASNVISCEANSRDLIIAIHRALNDKKFINSLKNTKSIYGIGATSSKIVKVLEGLDINSLKLRIKKFI
jgi:GDP/UDP-N,N'-diacetylbacillosamine 2-epimerase (hydrolysing)